MTEKELPTSNQWLKRQIRLAQKNLRELPP